MAEAKNLVSLVKSEHISPEDTGDNIGAKRVATYVWDGANWQRQGADLVPSAYDYIGYTNTNSTTDTYVYKSGGNGGTTIATVIIVFVDSTKAQISTVTRT